MVLSSIEQSIKSKIEAAGTPLKDWDINIYRGILTGYNEAFIIDGKKKDELIAADPKSGEVIRPILRGRDIKKFGFDFADLWLINTHNGLKESGIKPINVNDYPAIKKHLDSYFPGLQKRGDKGDTPYNLRNCAYMDDFYKHKIIYPELTKFLNFYFDNKNFLVNNKCFILSGEKIYYLIAFLNSSLFKFAFKDDFPELLGGTRELRKVFLEQVKVKYVSEEINVEFMRLVLKCQDLQGDQKKKKEYELEIDNMLFEIYDLNDDEREAIGFIVVQ
ncbi:TaqI-like C-terminal specificity domain-containing protein [Kaistella sp. PBT33-4]|uniref:TaqI-like C-terminal specificity domain-containing protein n=1 Tax=Kaistella sp. PBT33-4 TaxID=3032000 RepID=UPI0023D7F268|nr:TaqI-like C-terminal specificity domain-containing protein [Kaistella sp. PBT33-4]MDF0720135.1 TaqI-like C-terminal specificity domain-containing protein [Kaistella sp. PBT33-4]